MLRDLTKADWLSILSIPRDRIPHALMLRGTRNLKAHYEIYRSYFEDVLEVGSPNGVLDDLFIGRRKGATVAYASVYGAAMASEIVHVFGVLGTPLVVQTGNCGAIADQIGPGELFIATEAYCGEGASQYYKDDGKTVRASLELMASPAVKRITDFPVHFGHIYTTSALFAEGRRELDDWHQRGFAAVDMETAATFAVAEHFGMDRASILFAFDNPRRQDHILMEDSEKSDRRALGNKVMTQLSIDIIRSYVRERQK